MENYYPRSVVMLNKVTVLKRQKTQTTNFTPAKKKKKGVKSLYVILIM